MKKLAVLLLGVLFLLNGCTKEKAEEAAIKTYIQAVNNISNMESANFTLDMQFNAEINQEPQNFTIHLNGAYNTDTSNIQLNSSIDIEQKETDMDNLFSVYIKDNTLYLNFMNIQKFKTELTPYKNLINDLNLSKEKIFNTQNMIDENIIDEIKPFLKEVQKDHDKITFTLDSSKVKEYLKEQAKEKNTSKSDTLNQVNFDTITLSTTIKDDFIQDSQIHMIVKDPENEKDFIDVTISFTFTNINKVKNISFPKDLDTYEELDVNDLNNLL